jgi:hypothetical protein
MDASLFSRPLIVVLFVVVHVARLCSRLHHDDLKVAEYLARTAIKLGMWKFVQVGRRPASGACACCNLLLTWQQVMRSLRTVASAWCTSIAAGCCRCLVAGTT